MKYVLVVEDDPFVLKVYKNLRRRLIPPGFKIILTENVTDAMNKAKVIKNSLEIVCTDGNIPDGKGWDLVYKLKEQGFEGTCVYAGGEDPPEEKKILFDEIYLKPDTTNHLISLMNELYNQESATKRVTREKYFSARDS